eukprot:gene7720-15799_t
MLFKGNIPTELVGKILGGYLELDDICSFDTASSNSYRISYILSCLNSVHIRRPVRVWNESQCRWIQLRKLKVTDLEFARGCGSNALCYLLSDCLSLESCSFSKLCWYKLDFVDDDVILSISKGCPNLKKLNIKNCPKISSKALTYLSHGCKQLNDIEIDSISISDDDIQNFSSECKNLEKISFRNCNITSNGLKYIATNCSSITDIDFSNTNITTQGFEFLLSNFLNIKSISLNPNNVTNECQYCPNLISLTGIGDDITDQSLYIISQNCHKLKLLDISNKPLKNEDYSVTDMNITDQGIRILSEGCSLLESLTISSASQLTDLCLFYLGKNCKNLILFDWQDSDIMRNFTKEGFRNARLPRAFSYPFGFQI